MMASNQTSVDGSSMEMGVIVAPSGPAHAVMEDNSNRDKGVYLMTNINYNDCCGCEKPTKPHWTMYRMPSSDEWKFSLTETKGSDIQSLPIIGSINEEPGDGCCDNCLLPNGAFVSAGTRYKVYDEIVIPKTPSSATPRLIFEKDGGCTCGSFNLKANDGKTGALIGSVRTKMNCCGMSYEIYDASGKQKYRFGPDPVTMCGCEYTPSIAGVHLRSLDGKKLIEGEGEGDVFQPLFAKSKHDCDCCCDKYQSLLSIRYPTNTELDSIDPSLKPLLTTGALLVNLLEEQGASRFVIGA